MKKTIEKTNGKKTSFLAIVMAVFQIVIMLAPDLVDSGAEDIVEKIVGSGMAGTLIHKLIRHRKLVFKAVMWVVAKFKKKS